jgi:hypothetical protein
MTGRSVPAAAGAITNPVTSCGLSLTSVEWYRTFHAFAPWILVSISSCEINVPGCGMTAL